jgi:hypothetical protein
MSDPSGSTSTGAGVSLSSTFLEFCSKVRNNDASILPKHGQPFTIRPSLSDNEYTELAGALLENTNVTYLALNTEKYTESSAEKMVKYVRTSKRLRIMRWAKYGMTLRREEILCCFLLAIQESTSLKEIDIQLPLSGGPSVLAFENMLTHTQSLLSLTLRCPYGQHEDIALAAALSGLKRNTTLRELTLHCLHGATAVSPILTSLCDHPLLQRLCLRAHMMDLTGLEAVLLSDKSKITELEIHNIYDGGSVPPLGLTNVLRALGRHPALTKLRLTYLRLGRDEAKLIRMVLYNSPSFESLDLARNDLGSAGLAELAPALYRNTSIKVLDMRGNSLNDIESAEILRGILRSNKTITTLDFSYNYFGQTTGAVDCIAEGLGSNSTLLKINLSFCNLRDGGISTLARNIGSRNTTLQKLTLEYNSITSTGVGVLLDMMEHSFHITDLDLEHNPIGNGGASLVARAFAKQRVAKPHTPLSF